MRSSCVTVETNSSLRRSSSCSRSLAALRFCVADPDEREWLRPRLAVLLGVESDDSFVREDMFAAWTAFSDEDFITALTFSCCAEMIDSM